MSCDAVFVQLTVQTAEYLVEGRTAGAGSHFYRNVRVSAAAEDMKVEAFVIGASCAGDEGGAGRIDALSVGGDSYSAGEDVGG